MITDLWIQNFKGISSRQHIPLRPITLLFGANSAGKSTVLHALIYLREVLNNRNHDPKGALAGSQTVNLGGFQNLQNQPGQERIRIGVTVRRWLDDCYAPSYYLDRDFDGLLEDGALSRLEGSFTGLKYNGADPATRIEVAVDEEGVSSITFTMGRIPTATIWGPQDRATDEEQSSDTQDTHDLLCWLNPFTDILTPESQLVLESDSGLNELQNSWENSRTTSLRSIREKLTKLAAFHLVHGAVDTKSSDQDYLIVQNVFELPQPPTWINAEKFIQQQSGLGSLIPIREILEMATVSPLPPPTPEHPDVFLWVPFKEGTATLEDQASWSVVCPRKKGAGASASSTCQSKILKAVKQLRAAFCRDPHADAIPLRWAGSSLPPQCSKPLDFVASLIDPATQDLERAQIRQCEQLAFLDELIRGSLGMLLQCLNSITYVGPKRSSVPRNLTSDVIDDYRSWGDGLGAWRWLSNCSNDSLALCSKWLGSETWGLSTGYTLEREWMYAIDGQTLELLKHGVHPEELGWELEARDIEFAKQFNRVSLRDFANELKRHPQDVGEGITHVIPIIAAFVRSSTEDSRGHTIAVEQPELHLHPSLAARLGDLAITTMLPAHGSTALIETHSEHLILRLLRRVRQTTNGDLPEHLPEVRPDDVCVLYVDNMGDGTTIRRLRIDEDGEFIDRWPHGFFREREEDLFG